jgi:phosphohistidine phosphatase
MRRLILLRHAKAESRATDGEDIDRALTARGRHDAALVAAVLARTGLTPDLALISPALRARETWQCARDAFPDVETQVRDGLYNAAPEEVADELDVGTQGAETVIVIGHNPSLQELSVNMLLAGDGAAGDIERVSARFATSTAAAFRIDAAGRAALEGLFHARDHGGDGE